MGRSARRNTQGSYKFVDRAYIFFLRKPLVLDGDLWPPDRPARSSSSEFPHVSHDLSVAVAPRPVQVERLESRALADALPGQPAQVTAPTPVHRGRERRTSRPRSAAYKTAIGGVDNGNVAAPQSGGFRTINWDGVDLDGTDFGRGANSTVINSGKTVGIPQNVSSRAGVFFDTVYAVSGDGFADVNPNAAEPVPGLQREEHVRGRSTTTTIDFSFVAPERLRTPRRCRRPLGGSARSSSTRRSRTRRASSISTATNCWRRCFVPTGTQGQPEFVGDLFDSPDRHAGLDHPGHRHALQLRRQDRRRPGERRRGPHNLVVADDFIYPEPVPPGEPARDRRSRRAAPRPPRPRSMPAWSASRHRNRRDRLLFERHATAEQPLRRHQLGRRPADATARSRRTRWRASTSSARTRLCERRPVPDHGHGERLLRRPGDDRQHGAGEQAGDDGDARLVGNPGHRRQADHASRRP